MAACHYIGGGTRQFRFWRQPPPTNAEPAPGVKLFDVTFDPARAQPEGAFLRQMLETPVALPPGDYVIMVDTNGQDMGDNRIVNMVAPDLSKVFGAFNQDPGGYPYQIENRHAQPTIGTFWYALGALAPAAPPPAALSVAGPIRSPLLELKASTALTPQDMCGVIVITPSGPTTITLPKTTDYQAGYNQTVIFARNMAAGADFPVMLVAPAPGWEGRGVHALALNGVNPTYTVQANAAVYIHSGSMKVSAAYLLINSSSTTIPIPITAATYTTMTPIAFNDVSNPFAEFFTANDAKTTLTVKVGGSYQIGYQCCIDSKGGKAYQVCVALMVAPPGSAASTIIPGTQTAAGNY